LPKKKERQKTLKESQQKKGIKIPFLVILFLIVFGVSFLVNLLNNNSSNKRGDYMDVKYINKEPEPDPFQKPDVPANGGGGQGYQSGVDDPLLYMLENIWTNPLFMILLVVPFVIITVTVFRGMRRW